MLKASMVEFQKYKVIFLLCLRLMWLDFYILLM